MAKKAKKRAPKKAVRRRHSRLERERLMRNVIIWGSIAVGVVVVGLIVYGMIARSIRQSAMRGQPVANVNGEAITMGELETRIRFFEGLGWPLSSPEQVEYALDQLIREALIRQEAEARGVSIPPDEVQERIEREFGYHRTPPTPRPTPTPAPTVTATLQLTPTVTPLPTPTPLSKAAFNRLYQQRLDAIGVSEEYYRAVVEMELLQAALIEDFGADVADVADQVQVRYLSLESQDLMDEYWRRWAEGGEDYALLKEEAEAAEGNNMGSESMWYTKDLMANTFSEAFAEAAFSRASGVFTQTVTSDFGGVDYYVVEVMAHEEREIGESLQEKVARQAFNAWMEQEMAAVERFEYDASALISVTPQPQQPGLISP